MEKPAPNIVLIKEKVETDFATTTEEGHRMIIAFLRIKSPAQRARLIDLAETLAKP